MGQEHIVVHCISVVVMGSVQLTPSHLQQAAGVHWPLCHPATTSCTQAFSFRRDTQQGGKRKKKGGGGGGGGGKGWGGMRGGALE